MKWWERSSALGLLRAWLIAGWFFALLAFVFYLGTQERRRPTPVPVAQRDTTVAADSSVTVWRISDSVSIQVLFIPQGKGVNVLILPVKKHKEAR